jgi:hypothetical protein
LSLGGIHTFMKNAFALVAIVALLAGCTTTREAKMTIQPGVREQSTADESLFRDVLTQRGGVGYADFVLYPTSAQKTLTSIQVITPYDNHKTGVERWTIQHDGHDSCTYLVKFIPDGHGGTTFTVQKDAKP